MVPQGLYGCEVSADSPSWDTQVVRRRLHVLGQLGSKPDPGPTLSNTEYESGTQETRSGSGLIELNQIVKIWKNYSPLLCSDNFLMSLTFFNTYCLSKKSGHLLYSKLLYKLCQGKLLYKLCQDFLDKLYI